ncbi:hypothetical protein BDW22DRAFT_1362629 [Trametopsis cervina]|nr:hypothetical protein BDW22DRAFT_1362629 [Trametopsis cervina]
MPGADNAQSQPLSLPAPPSDNVTKLDTGNADSVKFDALGPLVVNSDGTLSRIANWQEMTEEERSRTTRVLLARNKIRLANQETKENVEMLQ